VAMSTTAASGCIWLQKLVELSAKKRGCHLITDEVVERLLPELKQVSIGVMHLLIQHTSASICLNENWDSSVRSDAEMALNRIVPENLPYKHTVEGADDMPAHIKSALIGSTLTIPITNGRPNLGTWQGIWLCEHRNSGGARKLIATIQGAPSQ